MPHVIQNVVLKVVCLFFFVLLKESVKLKTRCQHSKVLRRVKRNQVYQWHTAWWKIWEWPGLGNLWHYWIRILQDSSSSSSLWLSRLWWTRNFAPGGVPRPGQAHKARYLSSRCGLVWNVDRSVRTGLAVDTFFSVSLLRSKSFCALYYSQQVWKKWTARAQVKKGITRA